MINLLSVLYIIFIHPAVVSSVGQWFRDCWKHGYRGDHRGLALVILYVVTHGAGFGYFLYLKW